MNECRAAACRRALVRSQRRPGDERRPYSATLRPEAATSGRCHPIVTGLVGVGKSCEKNPRQENDRMKTSLFVRVGWFYLPASIPAGALWLLALAFCITVFLAVDRHSHSGSDTLYGVYPYFLTTFLLVDWVARRLSEKPAV